MSEPAPPGSRNGLGLGALVLGIFGMVGVFFGGGVALGVPGLILGIHAIRDVKQGRASNMKAAVTGVVISALGLIFSITFITWSIVAVPDECQDTEKYPSVADYQACIDTYAT